MFGKDKTPRPQIDDPFLKTFDLIFNWGLSFGIVAGIIGFILSCGLTVVIIWAVIKAVTHFFG